MASRSPARRSSRAVPLILAAACLIPAWAKAGPAADAPSDLEVLRARPTGMDDDPWRKRRREIAADLGERRDKDAVDALLEIVATERYDAVPLIAIEGPGPIGDPRAT